MLQYPWSLRLSGHAHEWVENDAQMLVWEDNGQASNAQVEEGSLKQAFNERSLKHPIQLIALLLTVLVMMYGSPEWASLYVVVGGVVP